jgi:Cys-tRNA(Pro)/Cys-tRNA(Cys) deacylase
VSRSAHRVPATPATRALDAASIAWVGHVYTHDPAVTAYGREASDALGVPVGRVFKTLMVDVDGALAVAIVPVADRLDLGTLAAVLGGKRAVLADRAVAERRTGYVAGGISPLGQRNAHRTVLDDSALAHQTVFVSGGRRGFDVELAARDLVGLTDAVVGHIVAGPRSAS